MDALGFRGILGRYDHEAVIAAVGSVRTKALSMKNWSEKGGLHDFRLGLAPGFHVGWFSDTLYIVAQQTSGIDDSDQELRGVLVDVVVKAVGICIQHAAQMTVPMVFRGVVTIGQAVVTDDNIYMGPAIDEAADLYERADGAFVWLSPEASRFAEEDLESAVVNYSVPLKGGQAFETWVVNPFINTIPNSNAGAPIRNGIESAMSSDRLDVLVKRQNTLRFLDHVAALEPSSSSPR